MAERATSASDRIDVRYVANLARLHLTDEEAAGFQGQLDHILAFFQALRGIDVEGVEPTAHAIQVRNVFRRDEVKPSLPRERVLELAPAETEGQFMVPRIVE